MTDLLGKIESELKCSLCEKFLSDPLLLQCGHSMCYTCGLNLLNNNPPRSNEDYSFDDSQSEADSGVVILPSHSSRINCSHCQYPIRMGVKNSLKSILPTDLWPRNICLDNLIKTVLGATDDVTCSHCTKKSSTFIKNTALVKAKWICRTCGLNSCDSCQMECSTRGHEIGPSTGKHVVVCWQHKANEGFDQSENLFCISCNQILCFYCLDKQGIHEHSSHVTIKINNQIQNLKKDLNSQLFQVSEKANHARDLINDLKTDSQNINAFYSNIEKDIHKKMDSLRELVEVKRSCLVDQIISAQKRHRKGIREKAAAYGKCLMKTTSLMHLTHELMKDPDSIAFLQIAPSLKYRFDHLRKDLTTNLTTKSNPQTSNNISASMTTRNCNLNMTKLNIDLASIQSMITNIGFASKSSDSPEILGYECSLSENNVATIKWTEYTHDKRPIVKQTKSWKSGSLVNSLSAHTISSSMTSNQPPGKTMLTTKYILEMDDGENGPFKVAYRGPDRICEIEGLQFGYCYRFRVKSTSISFTSDYSNVFLMRTPQYAKFTLDSCEKSANVRMSLDKMTAYLPSGHRSPSSTISSSMSHIDNQSILSGSSSACSSTSTGKEEKLKGFENSTGMSTLSSHSSSNMINTNNNDLVNRLLKANVGLCKGLHYWEFQVEEYDSSQGQLAFGVTLKGANKERMLGFDSKGWSMYMNETRSWFLHNGQHKDRTDGGLSQNPHNPKQSQGIRVGIRLDLIDGQLAFYRNGEPHGPIAFDLQKMSSENGRISDVYYPAVSLCPGSRIKLISGLVPPTESEESDEEDQSKVITSTMPFPKSNTTSDFKQNLFKF